MGGRKPLELTGLRSGKLVAIERAHKQGKMFLWRCRCDCGKETLIRATTFKNGPTQSCGCLMYPGHRLTHGYTTKSRGRAPGYRSWESMKVRCNDPGSPQFENYGARGISVCLEWQNDFAAFIQHIGPRPGPEYTVDRIDNDGNYEPGNVRWATAKMQQNNRRSVPDLQRRIDNLETAFAILLVAFCQYARFFGKEQP